MFVVGVIQDGVIPIDSETSGFVFLETLQGFRGILHNQPFFGQSPLWIERNDAVPRYVIHDERGMKICDALDDVLSKDGYDFDFLL